MFETYHYIMMVVLVILIGFWLWYRKKQQS